MHLDGTLEHLSQKNKHLCLSKNLYASVYSSSIHNIKNRKQPEYPLTGAWLNEL